jgi:glutaredoxin 3
VKFQVMDVSKDQTARKEMVEKTGRMSVPVVDIDGDIAVGYDEDWMREKLGIAPKAAPSFNR